MRKPNPVHLPAKSSLFYVYATYDNTGTLDGAVVARCYVNTLANALVDRGLENANVDLFTDRDAANAFAHKLVVDARDNDLMYGRLSGHELSLSYERMKLHAHLQAGRCAATIAVGGRMCSRRGTIHGLLCPRHAMSYRGHVDTIRERVEWCGLTGRFTPAPTTLTLGGRTLSANSHHGADVN